MWWLRERWLMVTEWSVLFMPYGRSCERLSVLLWRALLGLSAGAGKWSWCKGEKRNLVLSWKSVEQSLTVACSGCLKKIWINWYKGELVTSSFRVFISCMPLHRGKSPYNCWKEYWLLCLFKATLCGLSAFWQTWWRRRDGVSYCLSVMSHVVLFLNVSTKICASSFSRLRIVSFCQLFVHAVLCLSSRCVAAALLFPLLDGWSHKSWLAPLRV